MRKNRIRLNESQLHRVIKETVKKVLREGHVWTDGNENGPFEFDMESGYPTLQTRERGYDEYYDGDKTPIVRKQTAEPWEYEYLSKNPFATDDRSNASDYVRSGKIFPRDEHYQYSSQCDPIPAYDDMESFNKNQDNKMKANTKRAISASENRPLHRKGSLNRAMDESIRRAIRKVLH